MPSRVFVVKQSIPIAIPTPTPIWMKPRNHETRNHETMKSDLRCRKRGRPCRSSRVECRESRVDDTDPDPDPDPDLDETLKPETLKPETPKP
jgi:hypothetical protein